MKKSLLKIAIFFSVCLAVADYASASSGCVIAGPEDAHLMIEEYVDFECFYCAKGAETMKQVLQDYPGKVKLVLRNRPLPMHQHATIAAQAFVSVWLQSPSLAYDFQDKIFTNQWRLQREGAAFLLNTAKSLGVDIDQMKKEMTGARVAGILAKDEALAKSYGFNGTPSFRIGNESVKGSIPYGEFKKIIDRQLAH